MNTFLPYASFVQSAQSLDRQRLGKQRVEAMQIRRALENPAYGWQRHPAVAMWRGYSDALGMYMNACILEWVQRGYVNNMALAPVGTFPIPGWIGDESIHAAYRACLLAKAPEWYAQFGWTETPALFGAWPVGRAA